MDPNNNQPFPPQPERGPEPVPGPRPPQPGASTPDWQQGLGQPAAQPMPQPSATSPQPYAPQPPQPPQPWQQPNTAAQGEISMTNPGVADYAAVHAHKSKLPAVIIAVVVLLLLAGITYFAFFRSGGNADNAAKKSSNSAADGIDMATLESAQLEPPETIEGFTSRQTGTSSIKDYVSADGNCEFIVGTVSAAQLPGNSLEAIVKPQLDQLRDAGASVKGPDAGTPLLLKDANNKTYRMPTLNFEFSQDKKHAAVHYSAVILKNGDRAVINRACLNKDGEIDKEKLKALDEAAKKVVVRLAAKQ